MPHQQAALDYGFSVHRSNEHLFEVRRILKAKISADILSKMKEKLHDMSEHLLSSYQTTTLPGSGCAARGAELGTFTQHLET